MIEKAVQFGSFHTLIGVISEPDLPGDKQLPVVILINAGLIHRVGPNRVYVKLARKLANQGLIVLRFDLSGVGDSLPRPDHMPVEQFTIDDVVQAMDFLNSTYACERFVLIGHCAGAYHSIRTAAQDSRVTGVVMINPDGGEAEWVDYDRKRKLARYYENYYLKTTLADPNRWKRFINGQVSYRNVVNNILRNVIWSRMSGIIFRLKQRFSTPTPSPTDGKLYSIEAILTKLTDLNIQMMLIYSENSTGLERFESIPKKIISRLKTSGKLVLSVIPGADHIFSPLTTQAQLLATIQQWLQDRHSA
jgi:pimeloyl-ACP methyl ester carboxylesterase